jgi:hypothetical protein
MNKRLQLLGIGLVVMGIVFFAAGGYTLYKTQQGANALHTFSAAHNVKLNYNDKGELNPNDPVVNTASEYMYQMATIAYHTLHATTTVTFPEDVVVDGKVVQAAGTYDFANDGKYWTGFDRTDPIQGAARDKIWTGTAHALIAELGVGSVTASALTMGLGIAALFALIGLTVVMAGLGLVWAARASTEKVKAPAFKQVANPA